MGVLWLQRFCKIDVFRLHVNLKLGGGGLVWFALFCRGRLLQSWHQVSSRACLGSLAQLGGALNITDGAIHLLELRLVPIKILDLVLKHRGLRPRFLLHLADTLSTLILLIQLSHLVKAIDHLGRLLYLLVQDLDRS